MAVTSAISAEARAKQTNTSDGDGPDVKVGLAKLQTSKSTRRLQQISALRARGIGEHVGLPQLVVFGDQSAGKSSVLEGLTGLPFPRHDGLCTKFPTEIILEHHDTPRHIVATVLPAGDREATQREKLVGYSRTLTDFSLLPQVIAEVGALMGVRGFHGITAGPAFVEDVLRIKLTGPIGMHLSVVDLPGIITVPNEEQTQDDVLAVHRMVDAYASNPRTIILAVVQANNDIANQSIITKSRNVDPQGQRTVGIITKPDLVNEDTEDRIAMLANNKDTTKLKLGFFILKNPSPKELAAGMTPEARQVAELNFFRKAPWKDLGLDRERVGIAALRTFLQTLLDKHIERELPTVREEIKALMHSTQQELDALGLERPTLAQMRVFLSGLSTEFHGLISAALRGHYHEADPAFFDGSCPLEKSRRLRAIVHQLNRRFSDEMRDRGARRTISLPVAESSDTETEDADDSTTEQMSVSEDQMKEWIREVYVSCRGLELPGNSSHVLLSQLFQVQSSRWYGIAQQHVQEISDQICNFVDGALRHVTHDETLFQNVDRLIAVKLEENRCAAIAELRLLWADEQQQPITYNHYYTDNVQKARHNNIGDLIKEGLKAANFAEDDGRMAVHKFQVDGEKLLASLREHVVVDMDEQACSEALNSLQAYYKVALKTFVDNIARQVIERHFLRNLKHVFSPGHVAGLTDGELREIAEEAPDLIEKRRSLRELFEALDASFRELRH